MSRTKKYNQKLSLVDSEKLYSPKEAISLIKKMATAKFDETFEAHFSLGIDPRHADQQLRGTFKFPHGLGKDVKVAVIAQGEKIIEAKEAGADEVGGDDLIEKIQKGWLDFDILVSTPDMMSKLGKLGKLLGSKGLMPNPKTGTVTLDIKSSIQDFKSGKLEYRNDKFGVVHIQLGKMSFSENNLIEHFNLFYDLLQRIKPSKAKGIYFRSISVSSTMSPGLNIETVKAKWG
jgi:large subunit ribosomal protein L1